LVHIASIFRAEEHAQQNMWKNKLVLLFNPEDDGYMFF
jgi:hypothetical protein